MKSLAYREDQVNIVDEAWCKTTPDTSFPKIQVKTE